MTDLKAARADPALRLWGIAVIVMFLLTSVLGGSLASESSYLPLTLSSHIGLALVTLGIAGYATSFVGRNYRPVPRASAATAALAALGAAIAGAFFLLGDQSAAAVNAVDASMVVFAVLGIAAGLVMIVGGGPSGQRPTPSNNTHPHG